MLPYGDSSACSRHLPDDCSIRKASSGSLCSRRPSATARAPEALLERAAMRRHTADGYNITFVCDDDRLREMMVFVPPVPI